MVVDSAKLDLPNLCMIRIRRFCAGVDGSVVTPRSGNNTGGNPVFMNPPLALCYSAWCYRQPVHPRRYE